VGPPSGGRPGDIEDHDMIFPVVVIPWPPVRFILIVMAVIFVIFGALYYTSVL
jgi:hypothetical protein